jgi:hypothetical protein
VDKSDGEWLHSFDGIYSEVAKVMCEFYGFEVAKFAGSYNVFGWPSMFDMTDWSEQRGEKLNELTRALNAAGFTKEHDTYLTDREERRLEYERERKKNEDQNAQPGDGTQIEGSLGDLQEGPDNGLPQEQGQGG